MSGIALLRDVLQRLAAVGEVELFVFDLWKLMATGAPVGQEPVLHPLGPTQRAQHLDVLDQRHQLGVKFAIADQFLVHRRLSLQCRGKSIIAQKRRRLTLVNIGGLAGVTLAAFHTGRAPMRIWQELLTSTEGQFAIGVIGFMLVMGGWMLVAGLKKSRGKG